MTAVQVRHRLTDDIDRAEYERLIALLPAAERERAGKFVVEQDRVAFVAAHALLRETLSLYAGVAPGAWEFDINAFGKPALAGALAPPGLRFNLAHTRGLVACATGIGVDVGIDVERLGHGVNPLEIAARNFSPDEFRALQTCRGDEQPARFTELWTLKEAYIKAVGEGLSHPLDTFGFAFAGPSAILATLPAGQDETAWHFALWAPSAQHRMAVAVRTSPGIGTTIELPAAGRPCILARLSSGVSLSVLEGLDD